MSAKVGGGAQDVALRAGRDAMAYGRSVWYEDGPDIHDAARERQDSFAVAPPG
jgi:hypothetical protein